MQSLRLAKVVLGKTKSLMPALPDATAAMPRCVSVAARIAGSHNYHAAIFVPLPINCRYVDRRRSIVIAMSIIADSIKPLLVACRAGRVKPADAILFFSMPALINATLLFLPVRSGSLSVALMASRHPVIPDSKPYSRWLLFLPCRARAEKRARVQGAALAGH